MKRAISIIAVALALGGCASNAMQGGGSGGGESPLRSHLNDYQRTVAEGALAGAVAGGLIGLVASGGDHRRMTQNIITGAVAGGVVGGGIGLMVAGRKQEYASREQALDALVQDGQDRVARLSRLVAASEQLLAQRQRELARIKGMQGNAGAKAAAKQRLIADLEADRAALTDAVRMAEKSHGELQNNIAQVKQQMPAGVPPTVDTMQKQHEIEKRKLDPSRVKELLTQAMAA